jgi:predicted dehydrogenase
MNVIGLVGCGNWGRNILRDLIRLHCTVYVADIDPGARKQAAGSGAAGVCSRLDELPDCDGYVVAVPIPDLTDVTSKLLKNKKPVFAEKTLCLSMEDFELLREMGGETFVFAMHKWHYHPGIEALRQLAGSGKIGIIGEVCTTRHTWVEDFHGGDVFWTQAVHDLTIINHILGYIPETVRAVNVITNERGLPVSLTAIMGDKPAVILSVSGIHCDKISGVSIHGTKGSAMLHDAYDSFITVTTDDSVEKIPIDTTFPLYLELKEFIEYLQGGSRPRCDLTSAREITRAILNLRSAAGLPQVLGKKGKSKTSKTE